MPDMDGYTFVRQLRSLRAARGSQVRAIALTAYGGEIDRQQALAARFQKHLPKPVTPEALIEAIATVIKS